MAVSERDRPVHSLNQPDWSRLAVPNCLYIYIASKPVKRSGIMYDLFVFIKTLS